MTADYLTTLTAARAMLATADRQSPPSPAELAMRLVPGYRITPTIQLVSDALVRAAEEPDARVVLTTPPRTGKAVLVSQVFPVGADAPTRHRGHRQELRR